MCDDHIAARVPLPPPVCELVAPSPREKVWGAPAPKSFCKICNAAKKLPETGALGLSLGVGHILRKAQQIVGRNIEEAAQSLHILYAGFILIIFQIRDLSLGHIDDCSEFSLIQFFFFSEKFDLFAEGQFHNYHRPNFIIDSNFLFTFR